MTASPVVSQADGFVIHPDDVVYVVVDDPTPVVVEAGEGDPVAVVMVSGPAGPPGADGPPGEVVEPSFFAANLPADEQDGVNVLFPLPAEAKFPSQIQVFRNGLLELNGIGFTATSTHITFSTAPLDSDVVSVYYQV